MSTPTAAKYPCRNCKYKNACGDYERTEKCKGRVPIPRPKKKPWMREIITLCNDCMLPKGTGEEICRFVKKSHPKTKDVDVLYDRAWKLFHDALMEQ